MPSFIPTGPLSSVGSFSTSVPFSGTSGPDFVPGAGSYFRSPVTSAFTPGTTAPRGFFDQVGAYADSLTGVLEGAEGIVRGVRGMPPRVDRRFAGEGLGAWFTQLQQMADEARAAAQPGRPVQESEPETMARDVMKYLPARVEEMFQRSENPLVGGVTFDPRGFQIGTNLLR